MQEYEAKKGLSKTKIITLAAIGLVLFLWLLSCFHTVDTGQVGLVKRFGNVVRTQDSGFLVKAPWPIEQLTKMDIRQLKDEQPASAATKDLQNVGATVAVNYSLTPDHAKQVYTTVGKGYAAVVIDPIIQSSIKSVSSQYTAEELVTQRPKVSQEFYDLLKSKLTNRGITVENVSLTDFKFAASFDAAIEAKQAAAQNAEKAQYELQTATTQAQANATQQAALTPEILQQQAIAKWNGVLPTTVAGTDEVFNIPLK
jgi:regulator of protease activity HflC (stomatin/prohibitin superfamily)